MRCQKDSDSQTEKQNTSESLSKESAASRWVSEDNTKANETRASIPQQGKELSAESVKHNQEIVNAAVTYGRKVETNVGGEMEAQEVRRVYTRTKD